MTLDEIAARVQNLVGTAIVRLTAAGAVQRLQVDHGPHVAGASIGLRDQVPTAEPFGFYGRPTLKTVAYTLAMGGHRSNTVVVGFCSPDNRPADLAEGDACMAAHGRRVWLQGGAIMVDAGGGPVTVSNATEVTVTATTVRLECDRLEVTGDIIDQCDANDHTLADLRDAYNAHKHEGVQIGGDKTLIPDHLLP